MNSIDENIKEPLKHTHRSRWQRFSPSMGWKAFWSEIIIVILGVLIGGLVVAMYLPIFKLGAVV